MSRGYSDSDFENHFKHGRPLFRPAGRRDIEGLFVPASLWTCFCGRRFRGTARMEKHHAQSTCGVAYGHRG